MRYSYDIENYIPILREHAMNSTFVLELGPAKGDGSTMAFEEGLIVRNNYKTPELFISVDRIDYMEYKPKVSWWHLVIGDSRDRKTLDKVKDIAGDRKADLIFIDTHHVYENMRAELALWKDIADKNTVWLFHDTHMMGEYNPMTDAIKEFAQKSGYWVFEDLRTDAHGLGKMTYHEN